MCIVKKNNESERPKSEKVVNELAAANIPTRVSTCDEQATAFEVNQQFVSSSISLFPEQYQQSSSNQQNKRDKQEEN